MTVTDERDTSTQGQTDPETETQRATLVQEIQSQIDNIHVTEPATSDDPDPDSVEGQLRRILPAHTFYKKEQVVPAVVQKLLKQLGGSVEVVGADKIAAYFSDPTGMYLVEVFSCHSGEHGYRVELDGPGTDVEREVQTIPEIIDLIRQLGFVK